MQTLREAKIAVATAFLNNLMMKLQANREVYKVTGKISEQLAADIIMAPMLLVEMLENEEILHAERGHEADLENAYKR